MSPASTPDARALGWLLDRPEPVLRYLTARNVLGERPDYMPTELLTDRLVSGLLEGQRDDGGFGVHPYRKWTGGFWRLISLADLSAPGDHPSVRAAVHHVLDWLTGPTRHTRDRVVGGLTRHCAGQDGLGLAAACRLGYADDPRAEQLARWLVAWQWPDGGWNCDVNASGRRSSFHETHGPIDGLAAYAQATGADWATASADAAIELILAHHVVRPMHPAHSTDVLHPDMLLLRYPAYWHYGLLRGLVVLASTNRLLDPRARVALDLLQDRRGTNGRWPANGAWWRRPGSQGSNVEAVDWGSRDENAMVTFQALFVLRAAQELDL